MLGHGVQLGDGLIHLCDANRLLLGGRADLLDQRAHALHGIHHAADGGARVVHLPGAAGNLVDGGIDQGADFLGSARAALGQGTHLARHHGKASSLFAGARGLHRSVERQQVGLEGDAFNQPDDFIDLGRGLLHLAHGSTQLLHGPAAAGRHLAAPLTFLRHLGGSVGRLPHGAGQLLHRCGGLLQAAGLRLSARRQVVAALCDFCGRFGEVAHLGAHIAHHGPQVDLRLLQALHQALQGLGEVCAHGRSEVAARQVGPEAARFGNAAPHHRLEAPQHYCAAQHKQRSAHQHSRLALHSERIGHQGHQGHAQQHQGHALHERQLRNALHHAAPARALKHAGLQLQAGAPGSCLGPHLRVKLFSGRAFLRAGLGAHRHVATRLAAFHDGRDVGTDPVVVTVLAAVLHQPRPGLAPPDGAPHVAVGLGRHVGVANDVMGLADQLLHTIATHAHESLVAVRNFALGVGTGDQQLFTRVVVVLLRDWQVDAHADFPWVGWLDVGNGRTRTHR